MSNSKTLRGQVDVTRNPWVVSQTVSRDETERPWAAPNFLKRVEDMIHERRRESEARAWHGEDLHEIRN